MLKAQGYSVLVDPEQTVEHDTMTCAHCNKVTHLKAFVRPEDQGGYCRKCDRLICKDCAGKDCYPMGRRLDDWEKIGNGILAGSR